MTWLQRLGRILSGAWFAEALFEVGCWIGKKMFLFFEYEETRKYLEYMERQDRNWHILSVTENELSKIGFTGFENLFYAMSCEVEVLGSAMKISDALQYVKGRYANPLVPGQLPDGTFFSDKQMCCVSQEDVLHKIALHGYSNTANTYGIYADRLWFNKVSYIGFVRTFDIRDETIIVLAFHYSQGTCISSTTLRDLFATLSWFEFRRSKMHEIRDSHAAQHQRLAGSDGGGSPDDEGRDGGPVLRA